MPGPIQDLSHSPRGRRPLRLPCAPWTEPGSPTWPRTHHEPDNVLFSKLDLADGPLMAYDIQQLTAAPYQVILSACDACRATVRPGEENLGSPPPCSTSAPPT